MNASNSNLSSDSSSIGVLSMIAGECYVSVGSGGCHYFIPSESAGRDEGGWLVGRSVRYSQFSDEPVRAALPDSVEKRSFRCYSPVRGDIPAVVKAAFGA